MLEGANMDENGNDGGRTAMEQLARMLGECVLSCNDSAASWAEAHGIDCDDVLYTVIRDDARSDILRRIEDASAEDDCSDSYAAAALKALTSMHRGHAMCTRGEVDEMVAVVEQWKAKAAELDALKAAGRVMPEGLSWPRYADGEPVRVGDVLRTRGMMHGEYRVVGVSACGMASVVAEDVEDDDNIALLDPELMDRAPKAVGADGREVKVGDTVWMDGSDVEWVVRGVVGGLADLRDSRSGDGYYNDEGGVVCSRLARERPDSWERLCEDAAKGDIEYWGCEGHYCEECPAMVGGETPSERYGTANCYNAKQLDIVARAKRLAGVRGDE